MKILAIIPARSGSKGLKDKNIIDIYGRPLMDYTIVMPFFIAFLIRFLFFVSI